RATTKKQRRHQHENFELSITVTQRWIGSRRSARGWTCRSPERERWSQRQRAGGSDAGGHVELGSDGALLRVAEPGPRRQPPQREPERSSQRQRFGARDGREREHVPRVVLRRNGLPG